MKTFGREYEKLAALGFIKDEDAMQCELIVMVVDAVHDFLEQKIGEEKLVEIFASAAVDGGADVWERTGLWIHRLAMEYPGVSSVWNILAAHENSEVRYRVACSLNGMPRELCREIGSRLEKDKCEKVREKAASRWLLVDQAKPTNFISALLKPFLDIIFK